ncbi:MAG: glycoside hydrolase family 127 protein, partial [Armatimonadota bacterium]|nr:glycoside hydrolase family 127 protein [Armatimonadota bacterium]
DYLPKSLPAARADATGTPLPLKTGSAGPMGLERIARLVPRGYQSPPATSDEDIRWVQVDLGQSHPIERIKLFPVVDAPERAENFPVRFRLQSSDDPTFNSANLIADLTGSDYADPGDMVSTFRASGTVGRYVRLTVTRLRDKQFSLSKWEVWSGSKDVTEGCAVSDSVHGDLGPGVLTRAPRPQGEGVATDNPGNVIPAQQWKPVPYKAHAPVGGVELRPGVLRTAMENNIGYLLGSFSNDEMLRPFRERAGKPVPAGLRPPIAFWDTDLPGSNAGRFLMGAGNTLRWIEHPELRRRMDELVDGIAECQHADGYLMAYPEDTIFDSERGAYTRSWVTHGLIEAGFGGNAKAFDVLRRFYDWFNACSYLPELLRRAGQGVQGQIANTRVYFTPIGKPKDIQVVRRYFQENYWMDQLAKGESKAIWLYPYDHPHCYLITSLEPYLDQYRATGAKKYWDTARGGWDLYHDKWEHVGGTIAICEGDTHPPRSYYLHQHTGELCGSVFWAKFSQRFQLLDPDQEKYAAEIEKSIYNVTLANQVGSSSIRYHANLVGHKDAGAANNTCCEGQGTRMLGSLPEYLYAVADDGLYVNLFAPSSIRWTHQGQEWSLTQETDWPNENAVRLTVAPPHSGNATLQIRVPAWAMSEMPIQVNGVHAATGKPGTFVALNRHWQNGDTVTFTLPMGFKLTRYAGIEQNGANERYALEYGPVLMAVVGPSGEAAHLEVAPDSLIKRLRPVQDQPLHFTIDGDETHSYVPYWQVQDEAFTCYPIVGVPGTRAAATFAPGNLALASLGAVATSDSEYANETGGTVKVIDGIIAPSGDLSHRWHSSLTTPHPHWIQVKLPHPKTLETIVIRFADPAGHPTSFQGIARVHGKDKVLFDVRDYEDWHQYRTDIPPITTDTFRLIIRASANPTYPNAAQISAIELYSPSAKKQGQENL